MKLPITLLFCVLISFTACRKEKTTKEDNTSSLDIIAETQKLNELLAKYDAPSQQFSVPANKPAQVKGKQGTTIFINPNHLTTENGQPLGENIQIELKELTNQNQLLKANAQTVANGKLLVSGGAYYINMTSDGNQLKLKKGKKLAVEFPKLSNKEMKLFYGQQDSLGRMNWKLADQTFKEKAKPNYDSKTDVIIPSKRTSDVDDILAYTESDYGDAISDSTTMRITDKEIEKMERQAEAEDKLYAAVNLETFGWINCDYFLNFENTTNMFVDVHNTNNYDAVKVCLVFEGINSIMNSFYFAENDTIQLASFNNLPVGYKAKLIAYAIKEDKIFAHVAAITIKKNEKLTLELKEISETELQKSFNN